MVATAALSHVFVELAVIGIVLHFPFGPAAD
jgi:hypothetical protein